MNPIYSDEFTRQVLRPIAPDASPMKFVSPNGSPHVTPTKYRPDGGDRYIPLRENDDQWMQKYSTIGVEVLSGNPTKPASKARRNLAALSGNVDREDAAPPASSPTPNVPPTFISEALLSNELLNETIVDIQSEYMGNDGVRVLQRGPPHSLFRFSNRTPVKIGQPTSSLFSTSPLSYDSQRLLTSSRKPQRKVPKNPYKVLDAPDLQDDFYLNLVDWSSQNKLSVGLNACVYLWCAANSQVVKLCDLTSDGDSITSVQWAEKGEYLAVGTNRGKLQIWDVHAERMVQCIDAHTGRIGCLAWNRDNIASGSRDRTISIRDTRVPERESVEPRKLTAHRQEVCGLKWSPNKQYLASGGNDNQLLVWNTARTEPVHVYSDHNAAVKALAWSPHHHGVLVSGGGTADRCLRFWNTLTSQMINCTDTGGQVCNVMWSKHSSELVSTHGYSNNHVVIWKYPQMRSVAHLYGHTHRVLYLAMSPCGESIVTGAGDETLRFWHVFSRSNQNKLVRSPLDINNAIR